LGEADNVPLSHYFHSPPPRAGAPGSVQLKVAGRVLDLATDAGVFARSQIDPGTAVLLHELPSLPPAGALLDLGCGYGPIALTMAASRPEATVWAVDVNERARALCAANAATARLTNVRVSAPDEVPPDLRFDAILSNPPIRIGKEALHELLAAWLRRHQPAREAHLVVQKHLGSDSLHRWLNDQGWPTNRVASRKSFRVLRCRARELSQESRPT
jgi:16S rRNA (guanine1207-N2)-methyltransferase